MGISWFEAEPHVLEREREAMAAIAPRMHWIDGTGAGGWEGHAPSWPILRPRPAGLDNLLGGQRLDLRVEYLQAHPMVAPVLTPLDPVPARDRRLRHEWHLNGDGTLCLLEGAVYWSGTDSAAELVIKASGWFIEYLLKERGLIEQMSSTGLYDDQSRDGLLAAIE
jgi:hypothetical protein